MGFHKHSRQDRLPRLHELHQADKRAVCLHRFAGHELLAVEIMAYALLAFPTAPATFRKGIANTLKEEQDHVRRYMGRMQELGVQFGDLPLYRHFWSYIPYITTPLAYLSLMSLTFEMANLDFAPIFRTVFASHGDEKSSLLMEGIFKDEIAHVSFGYRWLKKWKRSDQSPWEAWAAHIPSKVPLSRARGPRFFADHRRLAGIDDDWIRRLELSGHHI
jgi:uncharacterized ferritin-like protein (DUF455 family)